MTIAFVFPGQGAQSVGMAKDLAETYPVAHDVLTVFHQVLEKSQGIHLQPVMFEGPEETLKQTLYTQPAILAHELAALRVFQTLVPDLKPTVTAGHSLGEYGALVAAGVFGVETAAECIAHRAALMNQAPAGGMAVVLGMASSDVEAHVHGVAQDHGLVLTVANFNAPDQVVVSGDAQAIPLIEARLKEAGAKRVLPLAVGGAFHSPLMGEAAKAFEKVTAQAVFQDAQCPVITNVDAEPTRSASALQRKLSQQIDHPVRWTQIMEVMFNGHGIKTVFEFGPGKVLAGLAKRAYPQVDFISVSDVPSLQTAVERAKEMVLTAV